MVHGLETMKRLNDDAVSSANADIANELETPTELAERALRVVRNYPSHVANREQARILKALAEHVIRLDR
jgi:hypothetical protein